MRASRRSAVYRVFSAAVIALLLIALLSGNALAAGTDGLTVETLTFRDVLALYAADRDSFGENASETDGDGVTNAAKRLAEMFTFTVGLNYAGEGLNCNYFGKDISAQMGAEPYTDANRLASYDVEILPYRSYAVALPQGQTTPQPESWPFVPEKQAEYCLAGGWKVTAGLFTADFEEKIQVVHKKDLKNRADYARITTLYTGLVLRARQPGDRFRPAGRGLSKPLRKWMNEAGVPNELRDTLPLLASGSEILWVCGEGFADGLAPDTESRWILHLDAEIETQEEKTNEYAR